MKPINGMIRTQLKQGNFRDSQLAKICPFIEQMGEWRHHGDLTFFYSDIALGLAPEDSVEEFEELARELTRRRIRFLDP
jgi:hypothetical protein